MATSTSSFLFGTASLCGAAGLVVVWSGLVAGGPEQGLELLDGGPGGADSRLLRLIVATRQGAGGLPLPDPGAAARTPPAAELAELLAEPAGAGDPPAAAPPAPSSTPSPATETPVAADDRAPAERLRRPVEPTRVVPPGLSPGPVEPPRRVLRRDPLEPPLLEDGWREWVLAVTLNGQEVSKGSLAAEEPTTGRLALPVAQLRLWRVRVDPAGAVTLQGEPFLPLDRLPGAEVALDRAALTLTLRLPPEAFETFTVAEGAEPGPPPASGTGAFLDYDLSATVGQGVEERLDGLVEAGLFGPPGVLTTSALLQDLAADPDLVRLESRLFRDFPERRASLRVGDSLTGAGSFAAPVRFGGLQWATNFATDPSFVTFPLPAIGGLAEQPAVVDVLIDNLKRSTGEVPPGPFSFASLPVVTGAGEVQLRVTDLLGRERILTQPYYVSARNLKEGLGEYSYEAGFERRRYGEESFEYGDALLAGTHRYGLTDDLTGELHGEAQLDRQALIAGGTARLGLWGAVTFGLGASHDSGEGGGWMGQLAYEYQAPRWSAGVRSRLSSDGWSELGSAGGVERVDQLNLGLDLGAAGRIGLLLANEERDRGEDRTVAAASWSLPIGPGALFLSAGQSFRPDHDLAVTATYTLPLGERTTVSAEARLRDERQNARLQVRRTRGASDLGLDWRVGAELGDAPRSYDARLSYQGGRGAADLEAERFDDESRLRLGVNGSLAFMDGTLEASRRLGQAFGLVDLPGFPNVRVYLDNREAGRTDAHGRLLLPGLRPYEANRVRLELDDLPLEANLERSEAVAVPFDRTGVVIGFPLDRRRQATAVLQGPAGAPLPAGLELASEDGTVTALVGRAGFTQVKGALDRPVVLRTTGAEKSLTCELPAAATGELLPDLGTVACR